MPIVGPVITTEPRLEAFVRGRSGVRREEEKGKEVQEGKAEQTGLERVRREERASERGREGERRGCRRKEKNKIQEEWGVDWIFTGGG